MIAEITELYTKPYLMRKLFFLFLFIVISFQARIFALEPVDGAASISGYVTDSQTGETLIGASVSIEGTRLGAITNKSGFFAINNIPPGKYNIVVSFVGYEKLKLSFTFASFASERKTLKLKPSSVMTEGISVEARRENEKREISVSRIDVPVQQIKKIRVGGETDVFRSLQYLPGILTSSQLSSGLFVRGGSPDQNLVLLDGATVYNPTHLFGFISTFNTDAIKDVELIKGGFPAEYGGRLSAVLNLTQKNGNREKYEGLASIGVISSRLSVEGPLPWIDGSFYLAGRRTYLDLLLGLLPQDPDNPYPDFKFYDLNGKLSLNVGANDRVFLSGFTSADILDYSSSGIELGLDINNLLGSARWTHIFSNNLFSNLIISRSRYVNNVNGDNAGFPYYIENSINDWSLKSSLEWFASEKLTVKYGIDVSNYDFVYLQNFTGKKDSTAAPGSVSLGSTNKLVTDWDWGLYAQANYRLTDLVSLQAGVRANYWSYSHYLSYDPRFALRFQLQENIAVKAAAGVFHQNLKLVSFGDFSISDIWLPTDSTLPASRADHYILSVETQPLESYDLNFDIYMKNMHNITELNQNFLNPVSGSSIFYNGNAVAYGAEVFLQKRSGKFTGWAGYALGFIFARFDSIKTVIFSGQSTTGLMISSLSGSTS
jgi:hypothetical protein